MNYEANIYCLFAEQVQARPQAAAVVVNSTTTVTYAALDARALAISQALQSHGLQPEQPVAIALSRSPDLVAALLGVLHAGGAYVPVDPDDPPLRQSRILEQSGCRLVVTDTPGRAALIGMSAANAWDILDLDQIARTPEKPAEPAAPGGARLAYILFTSGSTGQPKGVEIEHRSVVNLLRASRDLLGITNRDVVLAAATIGFDISVVELFLPLITGGRMLLRDRSCWLDPARLAREVRNFGVTMVQTGPSTWSSLLNTVPDFPVVRVAISTAEAIHPDLARRLAGQAEQVWNLYGPTETTVWSTAFRITRDTLEHHQHTRLSVAIGHPLANTSVLIVDEQGTPVVPGQPGELCLGGLGLARGYCRSPELTAQKFAALEPSGERYYRTGDIAAWSVDGNLLYYGRTDDQMKIRGHRVDPGEVEAALQAHPGVRQAAATWFETASGSRSILAAIVPAETGSVSSGVLYDWLAQRLPGPMIPSRYAFCDALPQAPSGKIDRHALRKMAAEEIARPSSGTDELTPTERAVGAIWCAVLGRESIRATDHFFTIGGDSLSAVRVLTRVEADRGIELPVQALFEAPTLRAFAARLDRAGAAVAPPGWWKNLHRRWQGWFHPRPEVTAPADLLARQHIYVDPWPGQRHHRNGLVVTLNEHGTRPGLFWCLQGYRELSQLAAALGAEQPVHGLRSGYLIMDYDCAEQMDLLTSHYAAEIQAVQPEGALLLGGNCQGGLLMHAVARRLLDQGRTIALLVLMEQKIPLPFPGPVVLLYGRESHLNPYRAPDADPDPGFRAAYSGGYTVRFIAGAHGSFFESPNVESLARELTDVLMPVASVNTGMDERLPLR